MANYGHPSLRRRVATKDKAMPNQKFKSAPTEALRKLNKVINGLAMLHNDQGTLYTSFAFRKAAKKYEIAQSYSRKNNFGDNAVMENWNTQDQMAVPSFIPLGQEHFEHQAGNERIQGYNKRIQAN